MNSIQGSNSLWNIDFSNADSIATINQEEQVQLEDSDYSARGLGFMSYVYATMGTNDDITKTDIGYVVQNADFLQDYNEDDIKSYLESNGTTFNTTIDWAEYEGVLSDEQISYLKDKYSGDLSVVDFCEAIDAIEKLKELAIFASGEEVEDSTVTVDSYALFASQMASALDSYINTSANLVDSSTSSYLDFLSTDYYSTDTFSFADHFESMIDDLMYNTNTDISGLLSVLDGLRESEASFAFSDILSELDSRTIYNLIEFSNSIG